MSPARYAWRGSLFWLTFASLPQFAPDPSVRVARESSIVESTLSGATVWARFRGPRSGVGKHDLGSVVSIVGELRPAAARVAWVRAFVCAIVFRFHGVAYGSACDECLARSVPRACHRPYFAGQLLVSACDLCSNVVAVRSRFVHSLRFGLSLAGKGSSLAMAGTL